MKVNHAPLFASFSGSLGDDTFQVHASGPIVRTRPNPPAPSSPAQLATQAHMTKLASLWSDMNSLYRTPWSNWVRWQPASPFGSVLAANWEPELSDEGETWAPPDPTIYPQLIAFIMPNLRPQGLMIYHYSLGGDASDLLYWLVRPKGESLWVPAYNGLQRGTRPASPVLIDGLVSGTTYQICLLVQAASGLLSAMETDYGVFP